MSMKILRESPAQILNAWTPWGPTPQFLRFLADRNERWAKRDGGIDCTVRTLRELADRIDAAQLGISITIIDD